MTAPDSPLAAALAERYRLEREIGAGGMATVWLAEDVRHHRKVAIKVLHPELSAVLGPDRFLKEIELTAALQHPHILPLFDSGSAGGLLYYVMPFVEGETLRARLEREKQLPLADAVRIAREVLDALAYAHGREVVHRDIKPENILLQNGHALVADFGIALAVHQAGGQRMTQTGLSLGTPQYMAPEQAMGEKHVDQRADIYALGAVAYEMMAGEPPFTGPTVQAIVAKVMTEPPMPLSKQRPSVPDYVESAVHTALEKLPADRFATAREFATAIGDGSELAHVGTRHSALGTRRGGKAESTGRAGTGASAGSRWIPWALALFFLASTVWAWLRPRAAAAPSRAAVRFAIRLPPGDNSTSLRLAVARDGSAIGYVDPAPGERGGVWVRRVDRAEPEHVGGTQDARTMTFSPDGASIAFVTGSRELRVVPRAGGTPVTLARGISFFDRVEWTPDGHVYGVSDDSGVVTRVSASGGAPEHLGAIEDSIGATLGFRAHRMPSVLPGGRAVLFGTYRGPGREGVIRALDLSTGVMRPVTPGRRAVGVLDGRLFVVTADGVLRSVAFDEARLTTRGPATPVLPGVLVFESAAQVALGPDGTLAYIPDVAQRSELVWVTRDGVESPLDSAVRKAFEIVAISPAGDKVAMSAAETDGAASVWLYDLRQRTMARFAPGSPLTHRPRWTPDGTAIVYVSDRGSPTGLRSLWRQPVDGGDTARVVVRSARHAQDVAWSPDGAWIAYREGYDDGGTLRDVRYVRTSGDTTSRPFAATRANEQSPAFSPDGRWLAWVSNESGRDEVYAAPFPGPGGRVVVSQGGGAEPAWARRGRELFYRALDGRLVSVTFAAGDRPEVASRRSLFDASRYALGNNYRSYDVAPDGRFLFIKPPPDPGAQVVVGWLDEVRAKLGR